MAAPCFLVAPTLISNRIRYEDPRNSNPLPSPPATQAEMNDPSLLPPNRNDSFSSVEGSNPTSPSDPAYQPAARRNSAMAAHRNPGLFGFQTVRTRSISGVHGSSGVIFEREPTTPTDDDVIIVTVRLMNKFRKSSVDGAEDLPSRPPRRSFIRRLSTRVSNTWDHAAEKEERYKAVKMPRGEYKRHFRRDKDGNYVGTGEEKIFYESEDLMREYAAYQEIPLHSIC